MPKKEACVRSFVARVHGLGAASSTGGRAGLDRVSQHVAPPFLSITPRPSADERDDRFQYRLGRAQISTVHAKLSIAVAHHHGAIARQAAARDVSQSESAEPAE